MDNMVISGALENWLGVVLTAIFLIWVIYATVRFFKMPYPEQIKLIKECLLNWVVQAETAFGGGTGKVKLSEVYCKFVTAFPTLKNLIPFETFSKLVDEALDDMRELLATNENLKQIVDGGTKNDGARKTG